MSIRKGKSVEKEREIKGGGKEIGKEGQRVKHCLNEVVGTLGCWRLTYLPSTVTVKQRFRQLLVSYEGVSSSHLPRGSQTLSYRGQKTSWGPGGVAKKV